MLQQAVKEIFDHQIISKPKYRPEVQKVIDEHELKYVLAQFVDIHGAAKTKSVPVSYTHLSCRRAIPGSSQRF